MLDAGFETLTSVIPGPAWTPSYSPELAPQTSARRRAPARAGRPSRAPAQARSVAPVRLEAKAEKPAITERKAAELLELHRPLAQRIVSTFQRKLPRHVLREDLLAAAMAGLWDAIRRHGATADDGFEWYASVRIRGAILDELRSQDWLSRRARAHAEASGGSIPPQMLHIEDMREPEQARCLQAASEGNDELEERARRAALAKAVDALPERERMIVAEHYFGEVKFKSLSVRLGVSEPRISQLHSRAMKRLRGIVSAQAL